MTLRTKIEQIIKAKVTDDYEAKKVVDEILQAIKEPPTERRGKVKKITEKQCLEYGGHCFIRTNEVLTSIPPQYPEVCKHCGKKRIGRQREPIEYYDP